MEHPEAYLRDLTAPLARARVGEPWPAARFSVEAVANAFVVLGLLPAADAGEILAAQRPVLQAAGLRVGVEIGELSISRAASGMEQARAAAPASLRRIPLAVSARPARCQLGHDVVLAWVTLTPEGLRIGYHGVGREDDAREASVASEEITAEITGMSITDDSGETYRVLADNVGGIVSGRRSASGRLVWVPEGEFLAMPTAETGAGGARAAVRWVEFSVGSGQPARVEIPPPAAVPTGTTQPPWPTPAECYLAEFAPPACDWSLNSAATGSVELETAEIQTAVADALLAVGALPSDSAVLTGIRNRVHGDWREALSDRQQTLVHAWAGKLPTTDAGLAVRLPFTQATAVIENITAQEDMVSIRLYGHPWIVTGSWPTIAPCFRVTAVDDTGVHHEGEPGNAGASIATQEGTGTFWFWPPIPPQATQLRITVSTLHEAAWAVIPIPGR